MQPCAPQLDRPKRVLIVDDDEDMQILIRNILTHEGYEIINCSRAKMALDLMAKEKPAGIDIILTDINMPEMNGFKLIKEVKSIDPLIPIVVITAFGSVPSAVQAMKIGAFDYIPKPFRIEDLKATVERTVNFRILQMENTRLKKEARNTRPVGQMVGKSTQMQQVFDLVRRVARVTANVLIYGESGTGKEMVARAIHAEGPRSSKPFVAINCSAIPESLLESELFGHARGSFTGAINKKRGLFEEAEGGTLFLDEIGDMDVNLQAKLLRVLQEKRIRPVGENRTVPVDVRIIAATHKDLRAAIAEGKFRDDLYYRLSVIPVYIPPLRDRQDDIPLFADFFLKKYAAANNPHVRGFTRAAMNKLYSCKWEGNVRQLENAVERAVILCDGPFIEDRHLSFLQSDNPIHVESDPHLSLKEMERRYLELALQRAGGQKKKAAQILGINRKTLYRKEKEYAARNLH